MEEGHAVAALGLVEVRRGHDNGRPPGGEIVEEAPEVAPGHGIDARRGLVEQQHARRVHERAGERELLLHAPGELAGEAIAEARQARGLEQAPRLLRACGPSDAEHVRVKVDVLVDGEVLVEPEALRHVADVALDALGVAHDVEARDGRRAAVGPEDAGEHAQRGGLARAVWPDEAEDLARPGDEAQAVDRERLRKAPGELPGVDGGLSHGPLRMRARWSRRRACRASARDPGSRRRCARGKRASPAPRASRRSSG